MLRGRDHLQRGINALRTLGHNAQADVSFVERVAPGFKAEAIVTHLKTPGRLLLHVQPHLRGPGMFAHIRQGFLHDVKHLDLQVG